MSESDPDGATDGGSPVLVEHFFRHEYGRIVSSLTRTFGTPRLELVEDAVQSALATALTSWAARGVPRRPGAWLQRVAHNHVVDQLRRRGLAARMEDAVPGPGEPVPPGDGATLGQEIADDQLRMLFVCCDDGLPPRTQLVLALKILCGFSVREIALRLLSSEEAVHKQIQRGRARLRAAPPELDSPSDAALRRRIGAVRQILYLLFNEGYSSARPQEPIRAELCDEALRLTRLLVAHPAGDQPESWALLALMHLHHARMAARTDGTGGLLLLEQQDRSKWDREEIHRGLACLSHAAAGEVFSRYHAEAGVLAEHCLAPAYAQTRWSEIVDLYLTLERIAPSPLHTLNRAIAMAEWQGPRAGLAILADLTPPGWLAGYYLWDATLGELHRRAGDLPIARAHLERALAAAPTHAERALIRRRLDACEGAGAKPVGKYKI